MLEVKQKFIQGETKATERTRLEKQKKKRKAKSFLQKQKPADIKS